MKKFTEKCAVDVSGWDKLTYGEVMFDTIQRVAGPEMGGVYYSDIDVEYNYLTVIGKSYNLASIKCVRDLELKHLTPTDILGEPLVEAIVDGYTPIFESDDDLPEGIFNIALEDGRVMREVDISKPWGASSKPIAYKLSQLSIESKILAEKVSYDLKSIEGETINNDNFNSTMKAIHRIKELYKECGLTVNQMKAFDDILLYLND